MKKRRRFINLSIFVLVSLVAMYVIGCKGSAGVRNGAIKGRCLQISGEPIPMGVRVRAEGVNDPFSRYTITDTGGEYYVADVPVGTYELYFIVDGFQLAMDEIGGGTIGTSVTGIQYWVPSGLKAFVENGRVYEVPTTYFKKIPIFQAVTVWGYVRNYYTNDTVQGAAITIGEGSAISGDDGRYEVDGVYAGKRIVTATRYGFEDFQTTDGQSVLINIANAGSNMMQYDIRMKPESANIYGDLREKEFIGIITVNGENDDMGWDKVKLSIEGIPILRLNGTEMVGANATNATLDGPTYTLSVPASSRSYKIKATYPYANPNYSGSEVTVSGLEAGQSATADTIIIEMVTANNVDVYVSTPNGDQGPDDFSIVSVDYSDPGSDTAYWDQAAAIGGDDYVTNTPAVFSRIPIGLRSFTTVSRLSASATDLSGEKYRVTSNSNQMTLTLK